jgi:hypothetical protein
MQRKLGKLGTAAILIASTNTALATWVEGKVYCDANSSGQIEIGQDIELEGVVVSALCQGATDSAGIPLATCLDPNEAFTRATVFGSDNQNHLIKSTNVIYDVSIGGAGLPADASIILPASIPAQFSFPMSASDEFSNPDYIHPYVAKIDWLVDSASCQEPEPAIQICTQVTLNSDMVSNFSDADSIAGDICDSFNQNIPVGVAGSVDGSYLLDVVNTGSETLVDVVINAPDFGLVNEPVPAECGSLEPGEICTIAFNDPNTVYSGLQKPNVCSVPGMVTNMATAVGRGETSGIVVSDDDPAVVNCVVEPHITMLKEVSLNGGEFLDANTVATGPSGLLGDDAAYRLTVTNDGTETLVNAVVSDVTLGLVNVALGVDLLPGDVIILNQGTVGFEALNVIDRCNSIGTHLNTARVDAEGEFSSTAVNSEDPAYVNCEDPQIELLKQVSIDGINFFDADLATDQDVPVGIVGLVDATYRLILTNIGSESLTNVMVTDAALGIDALISDLAPGETRVIASGDTGFGSLYQAARCEGTPGNKLNIATVSANGVISGAAVSDDNPANIKCISGPSIELLKQVSLTGAEPFYDADTVETGPTGLIGDDATYRMIVRNIGDEDLTNITIDDSALGIVSALVSELPIGAEVVLDSGDFGFDALYAAGRCDAVGTKLNVAQVHASGAITNTSVMDDDSANINCEAIEQCELSVDKTCSVKVVSSDDKLCTESISATTLRYTGPNQTNATISFSGKDGGNVVYTNVDLDSNVTILTQASQNGYTLDAGIGDKLGSKTTITLNGQDEIIHTSCSAIYFAGQPAPLDSNTPAPANSSKGDPSPNWTVVNFRQKDDVVIAESSNDGQALDSCDVPFSGAEVTYAYHVNNTGTSDIEVTSIFDDALGELLLATPTALAAGDSFSLSSAPVFINQTTMAAVNVTANVSGNTGVTCPAIDVADVVVAAAPEYSCADGKPVNLGITYVGGSCSDSNNSQGSSKSSCSGDSSGFEPVTMKLTDKKGGVYLSQLVNVGDTVVLDGNGQKLDSETNVIITKGNSVLQRINFHTSCSVPLAVGDQHGGIVISSFTPDVGGHGGKGSKGSKAKGSHGHKGSKAKKAKGSKAKGSHGHKGSKAKKAKGSKAKGSHGHKGSKSKKTKGSKDHHKKSKGKK